MLCNVRALDTGSCWRWRFCLDPWIEPVAGDGHGRGTGKCVMVCDMAIGGVGPELEHRVTVLDVTIRAVVAWQQKEAQQC